MVKKQMSLKKLTLKSNDVSTVERSKRRCFLTLTFLVKSVSENLLIKKKTKTKQKEKRKTAENIVFSVCYVAGLRFYHSKSGNCESKLMLIWF